MSNTENIDLYYIHLFNDFSGSPRVLRDAIDCHICKKENTFVFTSKHKGFLDGVNCNRVNCFYARSDNRYVQLFYFILSQAFLFIQLACYLLISLKKGHKITVVINTMLPFGAALAAKLVRAKIVYYVHETFIKPDLFKKMLRFFIEHCATHVIFVSKYLKDTECFSKPYQSVLYNGLRSDFPLQTEVNTKLKFAKKQLFFAGSLKSYKGIEQLLLLAPLLPEFEFIAALNCEQKELNLFVAYQTLPKNIVLHARPANIHRFYETSFMVLNLSLPDGWIETFGLSLIEGMAFGSPVIAPPIGGPVEFVNKQNGLLVDANDTDKIVNFIRYLNSSIAVWHSFSEQAFLTSKHFTAERYKSAFKCYLEQNNLV